MVTLAPPVPAEAVTAVEGPSPALLYAMTA
jgi:hypothetical protein